MPAVSKSQRRLFAMAEQDPKFAQARGIKMSRQSMHDFASTPESGLPQRVKRHKPSARRP